MTTFCLAKIKKKACTMVLLLFNCSDYLNSFVFPHSFISARMSESFCMHESPRVSECVCLDVDLVRIEKEEKNKF